MKNKAPTSKLILNILHTHIASWKWIENVLLYKAFIWTNCSYKKGTILCISRLQTLEFLWLARLNKIYLKQLKIHHFTQFLEQITGYLSLLEEFHLKIPSSNFSLGILDVFLHCQNNINIFADQVCIPSLCRKNE